MKHISHLAFSCLLVCLVTSCTDKNIDVEGPAKPDLSQWLTDNPNIAASIKLEQDASPSFWYGGTLTESSYADWTAADKSALQAAFDRAWNWIYVSTETNILGTEEFAMPLRCVFCEGRLISSPTSVPFTIIPEELSKRVYIAYVAQSLALEAGSKLRWSVKDASATELHNYFNSRSIMHRLGGTTEFFFGEPGGSGDARIKYLGTNSPATPIYAYRFLVNNGILKDTHEATILALLQWLRVNAVHFYNGPSYTNMNDHWGYPAQPSSYHVIRGTTLVGDATPNHWTAGCHGTAGFVKSILKAVNIPVEIIYTCGHSQLYFPTINKYVDHADDPYNAVVRTQPSKSISGILINSATHALWFSASPDYLLAANPLCANIGRAAAEF